MLLAGDVLVSVVSRLVLLLMLLLVLVVLVMLLVFGMTMMVWLRVEA